MKWARVGGLKDPEDTTSFFMSPLYIHAQEKKRFHDGFFFESIEGKSKNSYSVRGFSIVVSQGEKLRTKISIV